MNEKIDVDEIDQGIGDLGSEFTIEDSIDAMRKANCYEGWENELRYLMYRYEEHLAKKENLNFRNEQWEKIWMASAADSVEHIWAKSSAPEKQKHRLGNLVLLPPRLNAKLQDNDPDEKIDAYRKTGLLIAQEVVSRIRKKGWNAKTVEAREMDLLKWAEKEWAD